MKGGCEMTTAWTIIVIAFCVMGAAIVEYFAQH